MRPALCCTASASRSLGSQELRLKTRPRRQGGSGMQEWGAGLGGPQPQCGLGARASHHLHGPGRAHRGCSASQERLLLSQSGVAAAERCSRRMWVSPARARARAAAALQRTRLRPWAALHLTRMPPLERRVGGRSRTPVGLQIRLWLHLRRAAARGECILPPARCRLAGVRQVSPLRSTRKAPCVDDLAEPQRCMWLACVGTTSRQAGAGP